MFIVSLTYLQPLEMVDQHMEEHTEFLNRQYEARRFIVSGRKVPRTGGIILAKAESIEELKEILKEDPFYQHHIADYEITEFQITKYDLQFESLLDK